MPDPQNPEHSSEVNQPIPEQGGEKLSGEQIVEKSLGDIHAVETQVTQALQLEPGSLEAIEETDQALAHIAEATIDSEEATSDQKTDVLDDVAIETAIEIEHGVDAAKTPITILELDGYGEDVTAVVARLHETHATLPSNHEAAPLVVQAIEGHTDLSKLSGDVEFRVQMAAEQQVTPETLSNEAVVNDIIERLNGEQEKRTGTEIIDEATGEVLRPVFDITVESEADKQLVLDAIKMRRQLVARVDQLLSGPRDQHTAEQVATLLDNMTPVKYTYEGKASSGSLVDAYLSVDDTKRLVELGKHLDEALPNSTGKAWNEQYGLNETALAERIVDYTEQLIPEGTPLFHATSKASEIVKTGSLKSRFLRDTQAGYDATQSTGTHSNYVHFGEVGKANTPYAQGSDRGLVGIPIEDIVSQTPYAHTESKYLKLPGEAETQEKFGAVIVKNDEVAPLALRRRIAKVQQRFAGGLDRVVAGGGERANLSFARGDEKETAAAYEYPLDNAVVIIGGQNQYSDDEKGRFDSLAAKQQLYTFNEGAESAGANIVLPKSLAQGLAEIKVYGPISQRRVDFSEDQIGADHFQVPEGPILVPSDGDF